jgi:hypothetical protein
MTNNPSNRTDSKNLITLITKISLMNLIALMNPNNLTIITLLTLITLTSLVCRSLFSSRVFTFVLLLRLSGLLRLTELLGLLWLIELLQIRFSGCYKNPNDPNNPLVYCGFLQSCFVTLVLLLGLQELLGL